MGLARYFADTMLFNASCPKNVWVRTVEAGCSRLHTTTDLLRIMWRREHRVSTELVSEAMALHTLASQFGEEPD